MHREERASWWGLLISLFLLGILLANHKLNKSPVIPQITHPRNCLTMIKKQVFGNMSCACGMNEYGSVKLDCVQIIPGNPDRINSFAIEAKDLRE